MRVMVRTEAGGWVRTALLVGALAMTYAWLSVLASVVGAISSVPLPPWPARWLLIIGGVASVRGMQGGWHGRRGAGALFAASAMIAATVTVGAMRGHVWPAVGAQWLEQALKARLIPDEIRVPLVVGPLALALWWGGGWIGGGDLTGRAVVQIFGRGALGLFGGLLAAAIARTVGIMPAVPIADSTIFFIAAFVSLPLAHVASQQGQIGRSDSPVVEIDSEWFLLLVSAIVALMALAFLLTSLVSPTILEPVVTGMTFLVAVFEWVIHRLSDMLGMTPTPLAVSPAGGGGGAYQSGRHNLSPAVILWIIGGVGAAVAVLTLSRVAMRTGRTTSTQDYVEERTSIWSWEQTQAEWGHTLGAIGMRLHPRRVDDQRTPGTVRDAFRRFLQRGAVIGVPRAEMETPHEYAERLRRLISFHMADATCLTAAYVRVRYGEETLPPHDVTEILRAWERLDRDLARQGQERRKRRGHAASRQ